MSELYKNFNKHRIADVLVLLLLASLVGLYCYDAVQASSSILNLIFVLPVTVIVLALCLIQFVINVPKLQSETDKKEPISDVLVVMGLFAAYVISLHWLGFDVGTCLFLGVFLWLHGERRWPWLAGYSIGFAFALAIFFSKMLPYPMPMLLLNSAY
jgi:putative tricarboxylic transport membrane protein